MSEINSQFEGKISDLTLVGLISSEQGRYSNVNSIHKLVYSLTIETSQGTKNIKVSTPAKIERDCIRGDFESKLIGQQGGFVTEQFRSPDTTVAYNIVETFEVLSGDLKGRKYTSEYSVG